MNGRGEECPPSAVAPARSSSTFWRSIAKSRSVRLAIGVGMLVWLATKTHALSRLNEGYVDLKLPYAVAGVCFGVLTMAVRAWRWNLILADVGDALPVHRLLRIYAAAFFLGLVSPGRLGELVRIWMARDHARGLSSAASTVVFDRVFDVVPTLVISAAFGAAMGAGQASHLVAGIRIALGLLIAGAVYLLIFPQWLQSRVEAVTAATMRRFHISDDGEATQKVFSRRVLLRAFAVSVFSQGMVLFQTWLFCKAVGAQINPLVTFAIVTMATVIASLPLSVGGIGTREVAVAGALSALGVSQAQAMGFSLLTLVNFLVVAAVTMCAFVGRPADIAAIETGSRRSEAAPVPATHT
ncbi:flippase-like domain-containing protein [Luteibacter aegosomatis]|uniref:lysylphosphatidylglycerol synthase transmembrane domain-containing protein n=1 Tax=Luteibacter aegosomatis TaxID=2911537 RepID=UPI001FF7A532|nr:lysylphosphatidylglycerol synthase transmembrane domain-containing protein [Luteibacter aegosomatis]UPG85816.1 flippase-like domain-containing protein [Luteibacter aegosomatis]